MKIYLAHPITGLSFEEVVTYFDGTALRLKDIGYDVIHPMIGKSYLRAENNLKAGGYTFPPSTNHAIKERDRWMVSQADIILFDFSRAKSVSIGCCMELAWADLLGKHTIISLEADNVHRHAFIIECADIVFDNLLDALEYLEKLAGRKV